MKEFLKFITGEFYTLFWFAIGILFLVFATIAAVNKEEDRALGCIGIALACHARCEVKILQRKMKNKNED